ncbi:MAG TPA: Os1348 family NHLP clan protein [Gemmatimonadales bacterium]|jgi:hypothetical protein|nr:Os1348 family NHLP clan protein [Gemmatimonadales bacterium]
MHKNVELLIGRLATDPGLRRRFARDAGALLRDLAERGLELTRVEMDALAALDLEAIDTFAGTLDRRIRRAATPTLIAGDEP